MRYARARQRLWLSILVGSCSSPQPSSRGPASHDEATIDLEPSAPKRKIKFSSEEEATKKLDLYLEEYYANSFCVGKTWENLDSNFDTPERKEKRDKINQSIAEHNWGHLTPAQIRAGLHRLGNETSRVIVDGCIPRLANFYRPEAWIEDLSSELRRKDFGTKKIKRLHRMKDLKNRLIMIRNLSWSIPPGSDIGKPLVVFLKKNVPLDDDYATVDAFVRNIPQFRILEALEARVMLGDKTVRFDYANLQQRTDLTKNWPPWARDRLKESFWGQYRK